MQTRKIEPWLAWKRLCEELRIEEVDTQLGFQEFVRRYGEPHRAYHTLAHIQDCLEQFECVRHQCEYPLAVEMAIWFHDFVYDVQRKDNEAESQRAALRFLNRVYAKQRPSQDFENVIALTMQHIFFTGHTKTAEKNDTRIMVDIDLSILGRDLETYDRYTKQIREEYKSVLKPLYVLARRKVMGTFLARPHIYETPYFREHYELQARKNIERELRELRFF